MTEIIIISTAIIFLGLIGSMIIADSRSDKFDLNELNDRIDVYYSDRVNRFIFVREYKHLPKYFIDGDGAKFDLDKDDSVLFFQRYDKVGEL
jgi:hypothetical protein